MEKAANKANVAAEVNPRSAEEHKPESTDSHPFVGLQGAIGNQAVQRYISGHLLQTKLTVGSPTDAYEQEADQVAARIASPRTPAAEGPCACGGACPKCSGSSGPERIRLKTVPGASSQNHSVAPPSVHDALRSPGQPLDPPTRKEMEPRFGHDFSKVRVHSDRKAHESARQLNASAYTVGNDIVFDAGRFSPASQAGRSLLAHELTHVVQQHSESRVQRAPSDGPGNDFGGHPEGNCKIPWPKKKFHGSNKLKPTGRDIAIQYGLDVSEGHFCETPEGSVALLQYERTVLIRTEEGHEARLHITGEVAFFPPFNAKKGDLEQLKTPGASSMKWEVDVRYSKNILKKDGFDIAQVLTDWHTPKTGTGKAGSKYLPLALLAIAEPPFNQFFLSPAEQQKTLEDFLNRTAEAEIPDIRKRFEEWKKKEAAKKKLPPPPPTPPPIKDRIVTGPSKPKKPKQEQKTEDKGPPVPAEVLRPTNPVVGPVEVEEEKDEDKDDKDHWYSGLLRALAAIAIGLAVVAALAVVIIGAVYIVAGVVISFTAAMVIAGVILLVYGFYKALRHRASQKEYAGRPFAGLGRSFLDAIGVTGIQEAWTGEEVGTGRKLSDGERTERGVLGGFTFLTLLFGARGALKNAPVGPDVAPIPDLPPGPAIKPPTGIEPYKPPVAPDSPVPAEPLKPAEPPKPAEPLKPEEAPKPAEEVKPEEPPKPAEEVKPEEPTKPAEPVKPEEPPKPAEPVKPKEPAKPAEPPKTDVPLEPDKPAAPKTKPPRVKKPAKPAPQPKVKAPKPDKPAAPKTKPPSAKKPKPAPQPKVDTPPKPDKPSAPKTEPPPTKKAAKPASQSRAGDIGADPQRGVRAAIDRLDAKIKVDLAEIGKKAKEITKQRENVRQQKATLEKTPRDDSTRPDLLTKFKRAEKYLEELEERQSHREALNDLDRANRTQLQAALNAETYARPSFRVDVPEKVWAQALKDGNGKVLSPSKTEIKNFEDPWVMGHKPKYEFWKHQRSAAERGISREQFIEEYNNPDHYRPETAKDNSSHFYEDKTDEYLGP